MKTAFSQIAKEDGRYNADALKFVYEGLGFTVKAVNEEPQHISGQVLCNGLRQFALKKWGRLTKLVLEKWGVRTTKDFGEIVFLMIEYKWMSAQPTDSIDDFSDIYDFKEVFKDNFQFAGHEADEGH